MGERLYPEVHPRLLEWMHVDDHPTIRYAALWIKSLLVENQQLREDIARRAIGHCAGCGHYVQGSGENHTRFEPDSDGNLIPVQCDPVYPVTADDIEQLGTKN